MGIRLNKYIADSGLCSRRKADELIKSGKVFVGGKKVAELGTKIDPGKDVVRIEGKTISPIQEQVYYALNKPVGYVATSRDPQGRKKVTDLVPKEPRVYPVGRLDYDSEGLILLTNDGDWANKMMHPSFEKEKEYVVFAKAKTKFPISNFQFPSLESLRDVFIRGIKLKEGIARADWMGGLKQKNGIIEFNIVIHQGWNRQIRRMCEAVGLEVVKLKRIRIGNIRLGGLKVGEWKNIKP